MAENPDAASETTAQDQRSAPPETSGTNGSSPDATAPSPEAAPPPPAKKKMPRGRRRLLIVLGVIVGILAIGGGVAYFLYSSQFVSTDNAQVDGDKIDINAPTTGTLTDWSIDQGSTVKTNQLVGRITIQGSGAQPMMAIRSPGNGTVAVNSVVNGQYVNAGTELATAYDFSKIYVTARVDETDVEDVHLGAQVDIKVDAFSGQPVTGTVQEIQGSAAGVFSLFPESNTNGNFQKVTQVIPIKIALTNTNGLALVPGMNVTVYIHKK
ncbi:efflux RND transporter periplasmic adaptor subunit [Pseudonocardia spinosispora]|uniref:efflux RND transporter periplasmic adaptor subunit n=1 Tax=Pseudonocardia spinosispora TaxID=103441 RepID=UPI0004232147|nr:efflux RND transporter periplasmic adaptor subunit [Pseudonocardia spinosispora]